MTLGENTKLGITSHSPPLSVLTIRALCTDSVAAKFSHSYKWQVIIFLSIFFHAVDPPKITRHPESKSVETRTPTGFTVEATGDNLQFQWQKDGKDIERNTTRLQCSQTDNTSTLYLQRVVKSNQGHYKCLVKNLVEKSGMPSNTAKLTVCELFT